MKYWMIAAVVLLVLGGAVFLFSFAAADYDFFVIDPEVLTEKTYEIDESFQSIEIEENIGDVRFVLDDAGRVECSESQFVSYDVSVKNGTLRIRAVDQRRWYHYLGFSFSDRELTVYLPEAFYRNLSVETDTGDVSIPEGFTFEKANLSSDTGLILFCAKVSDRLRLETDTGDIRLISSAVSNLELETDTGDVEMADSSVGGSLSLETDTGEFRLTDVTCGALSVESDTGNMIFTRVFSVDRMSLLSDTGDIVFDSCDAPSIRIQTETGDVGGTFCSDKIFQVNTKSGDVKVPNSFRGDLCDVTTTTGDVILSISPNPVP